MRWSFWGPVLSIAAHVGIGAFVLGLPKNPTRKTHLIAVVEKNKKKKDDKKHEEDKPAKVDEPPPPPPKPVHAPKAPPKPVTENTPPPPTPAHAPPSSAAPHPALAALPNLGISMAGGGPGGVGIGVPTGGPHDVAPAGGPVEAARPPPKPKDECVEDPVKPKLVGGIAQDRIIAAAQAAGGVEGRIRLEILVDEAGNVTSVRVLAGLGGAVDEAAIAAAKRVKVTPSTKCGKRVAGRLVVAITVRNPD